MQDKNEKVSYKDTLNLPKTEFPIRSNPKIEDKELLNRWEKEDIYKKTFYQNKGNIKFVLHDGPPYANGHLHLGHAYNNVLKDIVCKSQRMLGKQVPVTPGWDCHGLPIELKVTHEQPGLSPEQLKKACRQYASKWVEIQKQERKQLGVFMDWDRPYLTMDYWYEAAIVRAFGHFIDQGYIERKNKTVPWCASCQTVLAQSEIEYEERKDPSIYVLFPININEVNKIFPQFKNKIVNLLVWTTTPWTLPLNRAVLLKPDTHYVVLEANDVLFVVAKSLADKICTMAGIEKKVVAEISSNKLAGIKIDHPFIPGLIVPIILDNSVSLEDGTACVHCAPGCGPEDYEVGVKNNLEIFSPLSPDGKYTIGIQPKNLEGMSVFDAQGWVINELSLHKNLFFKSSIRHSYPHCWRCHKGLIFRATKQWFCDLSKNNLKEKVLNGIDKLKMIPEKSHNRLKAALEGRLEWCLSRQRIWGVPIPALLCTNCDIPFIDKNLINKVIEGVAKEGIEFWDKVMISELVGDNFKCKHCNKNSFKKETDILDVWFDSGISHYAVLRDNPELQFPADMYLEGKDQHRGWFQSSLLTSFVLEKEACMKSIVTHGFTVDEHGKKMSKSLGNIVSPQEIIDKLGTDGLRLWASSIDFKDEAVVSQTLLTNVQEVHRKIRNTCRFLLSNLYDFDINKNAVDIENLTWIDKYALTQLYTLNQNIISQYQECRFTTVFHELTDYCAKDLSAFYLDIIKDRLYVEKSDGYLRRSAQTVCWYILDTLTKLMAPILSFTAELVSDNYQKNKTESIHLQQFADLNNHWQGLVNYISSKNFYLQIQDDKNDKIQLSKWFKQWQTLVEVRSAILKAIEGQREKGIIKHPLEAQVVVCFDLNKKEFNDLLIFLSDLEKNSKQSIDDFFKEFLIVSKFSIVESKTGLNESELKDLYVNVSRAEGDKCPRCWQYTITNHQHKLCDRCEEIVKQ